MINTVRIHSKAKKQLKRIPKYVVVHLQKWVEDVENRGVEEVRKLSLLRFRRYINMSTKKKSDALKFLERLTGGPLSIAKLLIAIREGEEETQTNFARKLRISRSNLCDIEKERRFISPELAAKFAKKLKESEEQFVRIALQDQLNRANLKYKVEIQDA